MKYILDREEVKEAVAHYVKNKSVGLSGKDLETDFMYDGTSHFLSGAEVKLVPPPTQEKKIIPKSE